MNKMICRMALVLAVTSLAGCGLKGPLYFPPPEKPKQQTKPVPKSAETTAEPSSVMTPAQNDRQSGTSTTTEPDVQSAQ